jgi:hypothetical protein
METTLTLVALIAALAVLIWSTRVGKKLKAQAANVSEIEERTRAILEREEAVLSRIEALVGRFEDGTRS